ILRREMGSEQTQPRQMDRAGPECFDHCRQRSCGPCDVDARVRGVLGESKFADAERQHRGKRPLEVELAFVDLTEMDEQLCFEPARLAKQLARAGDELGIAEYFDRGF